MPTITGSSNPDVLYGTAQEDVISGLGSDDLLYGFDGNDLLSGGSGDDLLYGGSGNDTLNGGAGEDLFWGQSGDDVVSYVSALAGLTLSLHEALASTGDAAGDVFSSIERFQLTNFADLFIGSTLANIIDGADGNDTLRGMAGNDSLEGGAGDDLLIGGEGADTLVGGGGIDTVSYAETDALNLDLTTPSASTGEAEGDVFIDIDRVILGAGSDSVLLATGIEVLGMAGDDTLCGGTQSDRLLGGTGHDLLKGEAGNDILYAGDESDPETFMSDYPNSLGGDLFGGNGNDSLYGGNIRDNLTGGAGNDSLSGEAADDTLSGESGTDVLAGGSGDDRLDGGFHNDTLYGGAGDDMMTGGTASDLLDGGDGLDTAIYDTQVTVQSADMLLSSGDARGDVFAGIEQVLFRGQGSLYVGSAQSMTLVFEAALGKVRPGLGAETVVGNGLDTVIDHSLATASLSLAGSTSQLSGSTGFAAADSYSAMAQVILGRAGDRVTLSGGASDLDQILGMSGRDRFALTGAFCDLDGGALNDTITGSLGDADAADTMALSGGTGNDLITVTGTSTQSRLHANGGDGVDTLTIARSNSQVLGGQGDDVIHVTGRDVAVQGDAGNDVITVVVTRGAGLLAEMAGGDGNDTITATAPANGHSGAAGSLNLNGGAGNDSLTGTAQAAGSTLTDVFQFTTGWGQDSLTGFDDGIDLVSFVAVAGLTGFADLVVTGGTSATLISFGGNSVLISGLALADFSASDVTFLF